MPLSVELLEAEVGHEFDATRRDLIEEILEVNSLIVRLVRLREEALRAVVCDDERAYLKVERVQQQGARVAAVLAHMYLEEQP